MSSLEGYNLADLEDDSANVITENSNGHSHKNSNNLYSSGDSIRMTSSTSSQVEVITIDSSDDDEQVSENEGNWAELPSLAVENIYSFLSRPDQSRMSQVCSRWAKELNSPSVWKTMKFYLPEHVCFSEIYPEVKFARKFGSMFCHVEIICTRVRNCLIGVIWKQLCWFLQAMEYSSQLSFIKFINMGKYFRHLDGILYEELFRTIISFFISQENLKTVTFVESHFSPEEGLELLKAVFHSDSNTIQDLTLLEFVNEDPFTVFSQRYMSNLSEVCAKLANVQLFEVDYTQIFEDVINCLYEKLSSGEYQLDREKLKMTTLKIHCEGKRQSLFKGIPPETWKYLAKIFPNMQVKMEVAIHSHLKRELDMFLVRGIPLQSLHFCFENLSASSRINISTLFTHFQICKYQDHLDVLSINWIPRIATFAGSVINFLQSCKKLQTFYLHATCDPSGIENVLQALLQNHPASFKSITIWLNYLRNSQEDKLRELSEEYYPLFNAEGIECLLVGDGRLRRRY